MIGLVGWGQVATQILAILMIGWGASQVGWGWDWVHMLYSIPQISISVKKDSIQFYVAKPSNSSINTPHPKKKKTYSTITTYMLSTHTTQN
jgi:hypothetical protein